MSNSKKTFAFVKLFLEGKFTLNDTLEIFKATEMVYGERAEAEVVEFFAHRGIASRGQGSVLKNMQDAHREGALNVRIVAYKVLLATDAITDPSPLNAQNILHILK